MTIELHHMDCMDYMSGCEDNAFDLAIVDPPYGIGDFSSMTSAKKYRKNRVSKSGTYTWNESTPTVDYFDELRRVSEHQIIWGANYYNCFSPKGGAIVWFKNIGHGDLSQCEIASYSKLKKVGYVHIDWQAGFMRTKSGGNFHPCEKPQLLYRWLLENYAEPGQRILDTHLGSGSSAIAAHYFGCDFVGCELDEDYFKAAVNRFNNETKQVAMF